MEESPKEGGVIESAFNTLYKNLLSKEIDPSVFLDEIVRLDQSNPERNSSLSAVELMTRPDIVDLFDELEERTDFYNIRSISFFHKAQIKLSKADTDVMEDFQNALLDSLKSGPEYKDWANYVSATIAYLNSDLVQLRKLVDNLELNKSLVRNFVQGLEERGHPDYLADYSKPREE